MKEQTQDQMFPEIDLKNIDAGDLLGVTDWFLPRDAGNPDRPGWYEVLDRASALGGSHVVERRHLAQRAFWNGSTWNFLVADTLAVITLSAQDSVSHITIHNIVWRGLVAEWTQPIGSLRTDAV